ncbi:MAG: hypothetical protein WC974_03015 [Thermoplasmata archaeon]
MKAKVEKLTIGTVIGIVAMLIALAAYFMPLYSMSMKIDNKTTFTETDSNVTTNVYVNTTGRGGNDYYTFIEISPTKFAVIKSPFNASGVNVSVVISSSQNISQSDIDNATNNITNNAKSNATNKSFGMSEDMAVGDLAKLPAPLTLELVMYIVIILGFVMGLWGVLRKNVRKRRNKFIVSGITVLIPVILALAAITMMPMLMSQFSKGSNSSGSSGSDSNPMGDIFKNMGASPMSGESSVLMNATNASEGSISLKWGLGTGAYMFIGACIVYFVAAAILSREKGKEQTAAPVAPKEEKKAELDAPKEVKSAEPIKAEPKPAVPPKADGELKTQEGKTQ